MPHQMRDHPQAERLVGHGADIALEDVSFSYPDTRQVFARCGDPLQQFGSNTLTSTPTDSSTPASRHTPSGGARKVYSPQFGSYGPTNRIRGECICGLLLLGNTVPHASIVGPQQACRQARQ